MNISLSSDQEAIVNNELRSGRFRTPEEVIAEALLTLRDRRVMSSGEERHGRSENAVREMLDFVEKNRTRLKDVSVKELIHEGHRR